MIHHKIRLLPGKLSAVVVIILCLGCAVSKTNSSHSILPSTALQPVGRYAYTNGKLELISSAVHFGFTFYGNECKIFASVPNGHNYLQYEVDGTYKKRIKIEASDSMPVTLTASGSGKHTVWIYKATEAHTGPIYIDRVEGNSLSAIKPAEAPFIEFIGNSITCGAAADPSDVACGTGVYHDQHNAYYAYGPRVARALGASYMLASVSGIGVYRNWNSNGPAMPEVYEKTNLQAHSPLLWNFSTYAPKVVSIALGTNDFSNGDGVKQRAPFDSAAFVNQYIAFVKLVKTKYPAAQIALLSSPMVKGNNRALLQNLLLAVKQNINNAYPSDKKVATFFFKPMDAHGCSGHPNVEDHAILANELIPFFRQLIK